MCVLSHSVGWKRKCSTKIIVVYRIPNEFDVIIIMMATLVACLWNWHLRCFGIRYLNAPRFCCTYDAADYVISVGQMQFWKAKIFPTKLIRWRKKIICVWGWGFNQWHLTFQMAPIRVKLEPNEIYSCEIIPSTMKCSVGCCSVDWLIFFCCAHTK